MKKFLATLIVSILSTVFVACDPTSTQISITTTTTAIATTTQTTTETTTLTTQTIPTTLLTTLPTVIDFGISSSGGDIQIGQFIVVTCYVYPPEAIQTFSIVIDDTSIANIAVSNSNIPGLMYIIEGLSVGTTTLTAYSDDGINSDTLIIIVSADSVGGAS
ncbi:MAG: hypothetical protein JEZ05_06075 [Tenericutes bacterium]|nr:hypothetical protein [Mycoplasmatota bacterium]